MISVDLESRRNQRVASAMSLSMQIETDWDWIYALLRQVENSNTAKDEIEKTIRALRGYPQSFT